MDAEDFIVNKSRETQVIKDLSAISPHIHGAILPQTFIIKAIYLSDLSTLVISADQGDAVWVADLEGVILEKMADINRETIYNAHSLYYL